MGNFEQGSCRGSGDRNSGHHLVLRSQLVDLFFCLLSSVLISIVHWLCFCLARNGLDKYTPFKNFPHVNNEVIPYLGNVFSSFKMLHNSLLFHLKLPCEGGREDIIQFSAAYNGGLPRAW